MSLKNTALYSIVDLKTREFSATRTMVTLCIQHGIRAWIENVGWELWTYHDVVAVCLSGNALGLDQQSYFTLDAVSTGMGERVWGYYSWCRKPVSYLVYDQPTQPGHPSVRTCGEYQATSQRAVMLCGWGEKAAGPHTHLALPISSVPFLHGMCRLHYKQILWPAGQCL